MKVLSGDKWEYGSKDPKFLRINKMVSKLYSNLEMSKDIIKPEITLELK